MGKDEAVSPYAGMFEIVECLFYSEVWISSTLKYFNFILGERKVNEMNILLCLSAFKCSYIGCLLFARQQLTLGSRHGIRCIRLTSALKESQCR